MLHSSAIAKKVLLPFLLVLPFASMHCSAGTAQGLEVDGGNGCPTTAPTVGSNCALPNGTQCGGYPGEAAAGCVCCGTQSTTFVCSNGKWSVLAVPMQDTSNAGPACPSNVPKQGSACTAPCGGPAMRCSFDCAHGEGYNSTAECVNGAWKVSQFETPCEAPAFDAGPDSGDGG